MKKQDFLFVFILIVIFLPFFVSDAVYGWYKSFNAAHGMVMSFLKFGVLATLGEMLGLRISAGVYNRKGFGNYVRPRPQSCGERGYPDCADLYPILFPEYLSAHRRRHLPGARWR